MGIEIPFPKNFERYVDLGQEALKNKEIALAVEYFQNAYNIERNFSLNFLIVNLLFDLGEYKKAYDLSEDFVSDYYEDIEYFSLYVQLLMQNKLFSKAHREIHLRMTQDIPKELNELLRLKKEVRRNELLVRQFEKKRIEEKVAVLKSIGQLPFYEQMNVVKEASALPQEDFIRVSRKLLLEKKTHLFVKSWLLEMLSTMRIHEEFEFLWLNDTRRIVTPSKIELPYENSTYHEVLHTLNEHLGANDPILMINLVEEIRLQFAAVYPFAQEWFDKPKVWAKGMIRYYWQDFSHELSEQERNEVNDKRRKLEEIMQAECSVER